MLKFQTDIDPITSEKVLTCYLLPQQQYTSSSTGKNKSTWNERKKEIEQIKSDI